MVAIHIRVLSLAGLLVLASAPAMASVITFDPLAGANGDVYTGHTEAGYNITPVGGSWFEAHAYGNPIPDIFAGPIGNPGNSTISITKNGGGLFHWVSVDLSSNGNNTGQYVVDGFINGAEQFSSGGGLASTNTFQTVSNPFDFGFYDTITIEVLPGAGVSSMNLDNIVLNPVPEPASMALVVGGLSLLARKRRAKA